jgi:hypothetical protein
MGPRIGVDEVGKRKMLSLLEIEPRFLGHLSRNQSLCRPNCPCYLNLEFSYKNLHAFIVFLIHAVCPAHVLT